MTVMEWTKNEFQITTDQERLDLAMIHGFPAKHSEWVRAIPRATLEKSVRNSLCFGVFHGNKQIGLAQIISDYSTIAHLGDVLVVPEYRVR